MTAFDRFFADFSQDLVMFIVIVATFLFVCAAETKTETPFVYSPTAAEELIDGLVKGLFEALIEYY